MIQVLWTVVKILLVESTDQRSSLGRTFHVLKSTHVRRVAK